MEKKKKSKAPLPTEKELIKQIFGDKPERTDCEGMRIYISLPISDYDINERKERAQVIYDKLKELFPGCKVFNPLCFVEEIREGKHPGYSADNLPSWEWFMAKDIRYLYHSTHIYFDHGWDESRGCTLEHAIVEDLNGKVITLPMLFD